MPSQKALDPKGMESKILIIRNVWIGSDSVIDTSELATLEYS